MNSLEPALTKQTPILSVIIPFYGVEEYIGQCLNSVRDQLLSDIEVILVDDGSPDSSADIAKRFVDEDSRFTLIAQKNAGLGAARNTGTRHATGEYITFVDSDDVVPPRGLWRLVTSLESSGSDFAAGNAYRFTRQRGSYQSWSHAEAFAHDAERVTIGERPDLAMDRMVWNKVYRRSFWDAHHFEFPEIRYEDYPVTSRAYLEADAVDVISEPVYYWRDRESGTSITQQTADVQNALERYTSAVLVLDVLDSHPQASPEVRRRIHAAFTRVDLVSMAATYAEASLSDQPVLADMIGELARRLETDADTPQTRIAQLVRDAARRGDFTQVAALGRWRADGSSKQLAKDLVAARSPMAIMRVARALTPRFSGLTGMAAKPLRSRLLSADHHDGLRLEVSTALRPEFSARAKLTAAIELDDSRIQLPLQVIGRDGNAVRSQVTVPTQVIASLQADANAKFVLSARLPGGLLRWDGDVSASAEALPGPFVAGSCIAQLISEGNLRLERADDVPIITTRVTEGNEFDLATAGDIETIVISGQQPLPAIELPTHARSADAQGTPQARFTEVDPVQVFQNDADDDPIMGSAERPILVRRASRPNADVGALLVGESADVSLPDGSIARMTRSADGRAVIRRSRR